MVLQPCVVGELGQDPDRLGDVQVKEWEKNNEFGVRDVPGVDGLPKVLVPPKSVQREEKRRKPYASL